LLIARAQVLLGSEPALAMHVDLNDLRIALRCLAQAGGEAWQRWCTHRTFRNLLWRLERQVLPGIVLHYALRKLHLRSWVEAAMIQGARRLVVLGAGCDGLATRIAQTTSDVTCVEIDQPATQRLKSSVGIHGVHLIPADLSKDDISTALLSAGMSPTVRAIVVAEGFLMYFTQEHVCRLLRQLADACAPGSQIAFSFMSHRSFVGAVSGINGWLRYVGEPFRCHLSPEQLLKLLSDHGWSLIEMADHRTLAKRLSRPAPLARGELLALAVRQ